MRHIALLILCILLPVLGAKAQPGPEAYGYDISYFMPKGQFSYDKDIPTPKAVLGFELGQQHAGWDQVVAYMRTLAAASPRVAVRETGRTYQHRPFIEVTITSAENQKNIETIRARHLRLAENGSLSDADIKDMPVVVSLLYSVHGNEASGVNAALAVAYHLTAAEGAAIDGLLRNTVVVMTPGVNPDGINRYASWVNTSRSLTNVSDVSSREFTEAWPSSRTNHYWIDCNRDLLMAQHPEGVNGLENYFHWLPNVVIDHHEQGALRPFYMSPGNPKRTHPLTPQQNQNFTAEISGYTARALDAIGTTYYSKEGYDDFYYGKGAAYGDCHGSVCLLYEQGSTRGHLRMTPNGEWAFPWTVRNQAYASFASIDAAYNMRERLLAYQKKWYEKAAADGKREAVQGYVFNSRGNKAVLFHFLENMKHHRINVYRLAKETQADGKTFRTADSYIVPVAQRNMQMVKTAWENMTEYGDSTFYDISTWTFPHAFNLKYAALKSVAGLLGEQVTDNPFPVGKVVGGKSGIGYVFSNTEYYAPRVAYGLQRMGIRVSASRRPFTFQSGSEKHAMGYGTYQVLVIDQCLTPDSLYSAISRLARENGVTVYSTATALMPDTDFGSSAFVALAQPKVAMIVGRGAGVQSNGEIWHLLDYRFAMRPVLIESAALTQKKLSAYNVLIMAGGTPTLTEASCEAIKEWVAGGGTLIATGASHAFVEKEGLLDLKEARAAKPEQTNEKSNTSRVLDSTPPKYVPYAKRTAASVGKAISGVILNCHLDKTHPLGWGLDQDELAVIKTNNYIFQHDRLAYVSPLHYTQKPLLSGYLAASNKKLLAGAPAVFAKAYKSGRVVYFADDMNFRSYFFGTSKVFLNAVMYHTCY